jgi:hypothetical protein
MGEQMENYGESDKTKKYIKTLQVENIELKKKIKKLKESEYDHLVWENLTRKQENEKLRQSVAFYQGVGQVSELELKQE